MKILSENISQVPKTVRHLSVSSFDDVPVGSKVILFSYSKIITPDQIKSYQIFNLHNSLLPKYRGLHAFTWAIINGESEIGFTLHKIDENIDNGEIVSQLKFQLFPTENINHAFSKGWELLNEWLPQQIELLNSDNYTLKTQNPMHATYFCRRKSEDSHINWNLPSIDILNLIRAVHPPYTEGAFSYIGDRKIIFCEINYNKKFSTYKSIPGQILCINNDGSVFIKTGDSFVVVRDVLYNDEKISLSKLISKPGLILT
jgi:methionyl-tRNA formyltransferase